MESGTRGGGIYLPEGKFGWDVYYGYLKIPREGQKVLPQCNSTWNQLDFPFRFFCKGLGANHWAFGF